MLPTLLKLGSFELSTYGVLVAAAYLIAISWLNSKRSEMGLREDDFWSLIYWLFGGALLGGKIGYAIVERDPTRLWRDPRYGFVFFGGLLGALLAGWIVQRRRKFSYLRAADYFGVALPLGHAIGRLGCLAAGCCYGRHTQMPWGLPLAGDPSRHPTQVYEAAACFAIALLVSRVGLPRVRDARWRPGAAFLLYLALYAVSRFAVEALRGDERGGFWWGLSPSQWGALVLLAAALALSLRRRK
ncbi:MAG: prolipoprotein diacylglyceryl transferase family protein [Elusimicrobiota bacterium]